MLAERLTLLVDMPSASEGNTGCVWGGLQAPTFHSPCAASRRPRALTGQRRSMYVVDEPVLRRAAAYTCAHAQPRRYTYARYTYAGSRCSWLSSHSRCPRP
jgi:hypothetical protein